MANQYIQVDDSWTADTTAETISDGGSYTSGAISLDEYLGAIVSIICDYGGTADEGIKVYVAGEGGDGTYEAVADEPFGIQLPATVSTTHRDRLVVDARNYASFKIIVTNDSGASVDVDIYYKRFQLESA